jgi:hypothetical protein
LNDPSHDVSTRVDLLHAAALACIDRMAGEDGSHYLRALVRARAMTYEEASAGEGDFEGSLRALCGRLWPRKHREIRGEPMRRFVALALANSERDGMGGPDARMIYAALMFLLGSGFATDPLHPWASKVIRSQGRGRELFQAAKDYLEAALEIIRHSGSG